jgi:predicted PurR-regulated permease PerM
MRGSIRDGNRAVKDSMNIKSAAPTRSRGGWLAGEPLLLIGVIILVLYFARTLLIPLAFAVVFNFLLAPAVSLLVRWRVKRGAAILLVILIFFSGFAGVSWVVTRQLVHVVETLPDYRTNIEDRFNELHTPLGGAAGRAISSLEEMGLELSSGSNPLAAAEQIHMAERKAARRRGVKGAAPTATDQAALPGTPGSPAAATPASPTPVQVIQPPESPIAYLGDLFLPILRPVGMAAIVFVFTIYILIHREELRNRLLMLAGMGHLNLMSQALKDAAERISRYLVMQFLVNGCFGLLFGLGLFALGVPDATLFGTIAALLRIVPYAGVLVSGSLPLIFSFAISTSWKQPIGILAVFLVIEMTTTYVVEPWLYGSKTGVSSLALLASAIFWSTLWGLPGLVLSTPLTVCLIVMGRHVPQMSFLHVLLGDDAELAPEARFYERLLGMDQAECRLIADKFVEGKPLVDLYEGMMLPALSLAKQDRQKGGLDDARGQFVFMSTAELLAEFSEYKDPHAQSSTAAVAPVAASREHYRHFPVVCVAASDEADELSATMLAQLLEQSGFNTILLPLSAVTSEILARLGEDRDTVVCISALPPFAFTAARNVTLRVRQHMPHNRILIGLWGAELDSENLKSRFGAARPTALATLLADAVQQIKAWDEDRQSQTVAVKTVAKTLVPVPTPDEALL